MSELGKPYRATLPARLSRLQVEQRPYVCPSYPLT